VSDYTAVCARTRLRWFAQQSRESINKDLTCTVFANCSGFTKCNTRSMAHILVLTLHNDTH